VAKLLEKGDRVQLTATTFGAEGMKIAELEEWWEFGG
jgi:hypothetical protein